MNTLAGQTILIVDDNPAVLDILERQLKDEFNVMIASSGKQAIRTVRMIERVSAVVMDINMPEMDGIAAGHAIRELDSSIGIVYHIGDPKQYGGGNGKKGKGRESASQGNAIVRLREEVRKAINSRTSCAPEQPDEEMMQSLFRSLGKSGTSGKFVDAVTRLAREGGAVMLEGEAGTGKERLAKTIHKLSRRKAMPFVVLDCATLTGASEAGQNDRSQGEGTQNYLELIGALDQAAGGTLYLQSVDCLDLNCQVVLLSFFRQLGTGVSKGDGSHAPDVRVISGVKVDTWHMLGQRRFNKDLYYCLSSSVVGTVPLRDRREELPQMIDGLFDSLKAARGKSLPIISDDAMEELKGHNWPGNFTQLQDVIRRLCEIHAEGVITGKDVYTFLTRNQPGHNPTKNILQKKSMNYQRQIIFEALVLADLNINRVARRLGVSETEVVGLIEEHNIDLVSISGRKQKILIVDGDQLVLEAMRMMLSEDYLILTASSGKEAIEILRKTSDIVSVTLNIKLARMDGVTLARTIRHEDSIIPIIVHSGYPSSIVDQLTDEELQPYAFVEKGRNAYDILRTLRNKVGKRLLKGVIPCTVELEEPCEPVFCHLPAIASVEDAVTRLSTDDESVLLVGENGTGRSLVARSIHFRSKRRNRPLILYGTAGKSHEQIEDELFGDREGAINETLRSVLTKANGGTLLIKDIDRLGPTSQEKLVSCIEVGRYSLIGGRVTISTDVRIMSTTRKDLGILVTQRCFRKDLYYHLINGAVQLPGIEDRPDDIPSFIETYTEGLFESGALPRKSFSDKAIKTLSSYDWPGNIRQLMGVVKILLATCQSNTVDVADVINLMGPADSVGPVDEN